MLLVANFVEVRYTTCGGFCETLMGVITDDRQKNT